MLSACSRTLVLIAAAAVLANAQCYGACAAATGKIPQAPSKRCHHHKSSPEDQGCSHSHPEFSGPEAGAANMSAPGTVAPALLAAADSPAAPGPAMPLFARDASPPGNRIVSTLSILRI